MAAWRRSGKANGKNIQSLTSKKKKETNERRNINAIHHGEAAKRRNGKAAERRNDKAAKQTAKQGDEAATRQNGEAAKQAKPTIQ